MKREEFEASQIFPRADAERKNAAGKEKSGGHKDAERGRRKVLKCYCNGGLAFVQPAPEISMWIKLV